MILWARMLAGTKMQFFKMFVKECWCSCSCLLLVQQAAPPYPIPMNQSIQSGSDTRSTEFLLVGLFATAQHESSKVTTCLKVREDSLLDDFCTAYLDDILIYSEDPLQHKEHVA